MVEVETVQGFEQAENNDVPFFFYPFLCRFAPLAPIRCLQRIRLCVTMVRLPVRRNNLAVD